MKPSVERLGRLCVVFSVAFGGTTVGTGCAELADHGPGERLVISVAPIDLPGLTDACYSLAVLNADPGVAAFGEPAASLVWQQADLAAGALCSTNYGNGAGGDISFVGTCDASSNLNWVQLSLDTLSTANGQLVEGQGTGDGFQNPCPDSAPCVVAADCNANEDTPVTFNVTILRSANQGFFDVAVNFEDIFCSAKLDCVDALLHNDDGDRAETAVMAFACTSGQGEATWMYMSDITISCTGDGGTGPIDPAGGGCTDVSGVTWEDDFFDYQLAPAPDDAWDSDYRHTETGTTYSASSVTVDEGAGNTGGTPDPFFVVDTTHSGGTFHHTWVLWGETVWDPATDGAIQGVDVSLDVRHVLTEGSKKINDPLVWQNLAPGAGGGVQFALMQDGIVFSPSIGTACSAGTDCGEWKTHSGSWDIPALGTLSNALNGVGNETLDLTASGSPVTFGFVIAQSHGDTNWVIRRVFDVDNYSVTIRAVCSEQPGDPGSEGVQGPVDPYTYQTSIFWGAEQLPGLDKCYWNTAMGLKLPALGDNCSIQAVGTASPVAFPGGNSPADGPWPVVTWNVPLTQEGAFVCGQHALNVTNSGVTTEYEDAMYFPNVRECVAE
jgi:hypothetical protein